MSVETGKMKVQAHKSKDEVLLSIQNLRVWFELRRWGFGHAGYVRAVDNVTFEVHHGEAIATVQPSSPVLAVAPGPFSTGGR